MATPTVPEKRLLAAAVKIGSAWGTAVAVGAGNGILLEDDGGLKQSRDYFAAPESDTPFTACGALGPNNPVEFNPGFTMRYDPTGLGDLIGSLFGTIAAPAQQGATAAYLHEFQWADHVFGKFYTFCIERPNVIFEVPSAKVAGVSFNFADGMLKGNVALKGNLIKDDSSVNTATQLDAVTYDDKCNIIRFNEAAFKMNDESAGDVTGETALQLSDGNWEFNRNMDAVVVAKGDEMIEPNENANPTVQLTMNFPRMNTINDAYFGDFNAQTLKKVLIQFTGVLIESTYYYDLKFYFPRMRIIDVDYPFNDVVPATVVLQAEETDAAPTGMTYLRPYVELINQRTTQYGT